MQGTSLGTLGALKERGYYLWAACASSFSCHHTADLDMDVLIKRFGADFDFVDRRAELIAVIPCSKCGGREVEIRIAEISVPKPGVVTTYGGLPPKR